MDFLYLVTVVQLIRRSDLQKPSLRSQMDVAALFWRVRKDGRIETTTKKETVA
jgi:hypothetical protein